MEKKIVAVTGASRGIGEGIASLLAENGYIVAICASSSPEDETVKATLSKLRAFDERCIYVQCDISNTESRKNFIDTIFNTYGKLDILVNNAGVAPLVRNDILEMTEESMDRLLSINLKGTFFLTQYAANKMIENNCGEAIVNITSMSAYVSSTSRGEYCISKAGLAMVTSLFADRLAEYGINVYELRPGIIDTAMTAKVKDKYQKLISEGILPIKRMGMPYDIARAVLGIADGMIRYSTGEVINIDGGYHLRRL